MKTTYNNIEIEYNESANTWDFELRNRCRSVASLALAKEAIDKPVPADRKAFERTKVYYKHYRSLPEKAEITSIAGNKFGQMHVWISIAGTRKMVNIRELFALTKKNESLMALYEKNEKIISCLQTECDDISSKLEHYTLPANVE